MRRLLIVLLLVVAGLTTVSVAGAATTTSTTFVAVLSADTVTGCDTIATGVAIVTVNEDLTLSYRLIVANLDDVISAHIHFGGPGETGGIAAGLFDAGGVPVDADGVLATGTINDRDLAAALLAGDPFYVNVHTNTSDECALGAVRGQLMLAGPR
jgi:hypothetical protein